MTSPRGRERPADGRSPDFMGLASRCLQFSAFPVAVADYNTPDLSIVYANAAFKRMTGYSLRESIGRNCRSRQDVQDIREAMERGDTCSILIRGRRRRREISWDCVHLSPVPGADGRITHCLGVQAPGPDACNASGPSGPVRRLRDALARKDAALREMLSQLQRETLSLRERLDRSLVGAVYPLLNALQPHLPASATALLSALRRNVADLTSLAGGEPPPAVLSLTPRERMICQLIRQGSGSKEIAHICCISSATVENQRNAVRRKLGILGKSVNLSSYLQSLPDSAFQGNGYPAAAKSTPQAS